MPGANIGWDNATPAGTELESLGPTRIKSLKTSVQQALDAEHVFPTTGGAGTGAHRPGSAVAHYGTQSAVSSGDTNGKLMFTSDSSRLFGTPSNGTVFIGGATVISAGSFPGGAAPQRSHWVEEFGEAITDAQGIVTITFPGSGFSGKPYVKTQLFVLNGITTGNWATPIAISKTAMDVVTRSSAGSASAQSFFWFSTGTRAL